MTMSERIYLTLVLAVALVFVSMLGEQVTHSLSLSLTGPRAQSPSAGQPRQVDMRALEEQIRRGTLSEHEAVHYRRVGEGRTAP